MFTSLTSLGTLNVSKQFGGANFKAFFFIAQTEDHVWAIKEQDVYLFYL